MHAVDTQQRKSRRPYWIADPPQVEDPEEDGGGFVEIPLLGWVAAGGPVDISEYRDTVRVPRPMVSRDTYALQVRGHSMIDDDIQDGDVIVIEKSRTAENGQSVVAMINGEQVTLKRFYVEADGIRLQPANPDMAAIRLRNEEIRVLGIVSGVIRQSHRLAPC